MSVAVVVAVGAVMVMLLKMTILLRRSQKVELHCECRWRTRRSAEDSWRLGGMSSSSDHVVQCCVAGADAK